MYEYIPYYCMYTVGMYSTFHWFINLVCAQEASAHTLPYYLQDDEHVSKYCTVHTSIVLQVSEYITYLWYVHVLYSQCTCRMLVYTYD